MRRARAETAGVTAVSGRMLAVQRQRILELLEHPPSGSLAWRWVPVATVALLALALFLSHPIGNSLPPPAAVTAESDAELFTDVYAMEQDVEPRAAAPIRALFQDTLFELATPAEESQKQ
jgi:hypothetical protein